MHAIQWAMALSSLMPFRDREQQPVRLKRLMRKQRSAVTDEAKNVSKCESPLNTKGVRIPTRWQRNLHLFGDTEACAVMDQHA